MDHDCPKRNFVDWSGQRSEWGHPTQRRFADPSGPTIRPGQLVLLAAQVSVKAT